MVQSSAFTICATVCVTIVRARLGNLVERTAHVRYDNGMVPNTPGTSVLTSSPTLL